MGRFFFRGPGMVKGEASIRSGAQTAIPKKAGRRNLKAFDKLGKGGGRLDGKDVPKERIKYLRSKNAKLAKKGQELSKKAKAELGSFGKQAGCDTASEVRALAYEKMINSERIRKGQSPIDYDDGPAPISDSDEDDMDEDELDGDDDSVEEASPEDDAPQKRRPPPVNPYKKAAIAEQQKQKRLDKKKEQPPASKKKSKAAASKKQKRMTADVSDDSDVDDDVRPKKGKGKAQAKPKPKSKPTASSRMDKIRKMVPSEELHFSDEMSEDGSEPVPVEAPTEDVYEDLETTENDIEDEDDNPTWEAINSSPTKGKASRNSSQATQQKKRVVDSDDDEAVEFQPNGLLPSPPRAPAKTGTSTSKASKAKKSSSKRQKTIDITSDDEPSDETPPPGPVKKSPKAPIKRVGGAGPHVLGGAPGKAAPSTSSVGEKKRSLALREMADQVAQKKARDAKGQPLGAKPRTQPASPVRQSSASSQPQAGPSRPKSQPQPVQQRSASQPGPSRAIIPAPREYTAAYSSPSVASASSRGPRTPSSPTRLSLPSGPKTWSCPTCTLDNPAYMSDCDGCRTVRPRPSEAIEGGWECRDCGVVTEKEFWSCRGCHQMKRPDQ